MQFEQHCQQLTSKLQSKCAAAEVLQDWENQLKGDIRPARLQAAPLALPQCGEWLYLYIIDKRVAPLQHSQRLVLAHAGHALAQRLVIVEQANHPSFFSEPVAIQRVVARMNQGCFSPLTSDNAIANLTCGSQDPVSRGY